MANTLLHTIKEKITFIKDVGAEVVINKEKFTIVLKQPSINMAAANEQGVVLGYKDENTKEESIEYYRGAEKKFKYTFPEEGTLF
mmetsp:Transcript_10843/g.15882  ORF Transcript_10843/g.15882 Transcript_10843/m.15882 type:complete len:85 (-) Transcript_10843:2265-2519(-)